MNLSGADMGKGEQLNISVEMPSSKIHGCDFRSTGRQRRLVCITLFAALLPFVITRSYFSFISSDVPSEATSFFEEHPPPSTHFDKPQREGVPEVAEVTPLHSNSSSTPSNNEQMESESRREEPEPNFSDENSSNVTSTAGDEQQAKPNDLEMKNPILNETSVQSLITSANGSSSDVKIETENGSPAVNSSLEHSTIEAEESMKDEKIGEIVMEGTEAPSSAQNSSDGLIPEGVCNLEKGNWIPDSQPPLYNSSTCKYIQGLQNCHTNGRPDDEYLYWKWKPDQCELPRIDAAAFLNAMRNRSVVFAGDSIARNQFQSLLCVLSQVEDPKHTYWSEDGRNNIHHFRLFNFTLSVRWSPYLVRIEEKLVTWPDNTTENVRHVYLDEPDEMWVKAAVGADIVQLSTGQWWYQRARYVEKNVSLGCHGLPHCDKKIGFPDPYLKALAHVMRGSLTIPGFNGTVVYRSFSPEHFENGNWDTGGECVRTTPGGVSMSYDTDHMYGIQKKSFKNVTEELETVAKDRLRLLGITDLAQIRADGHPNKYRTEAQKKAERKGNVTPNDCLHWCLPGPIDTWNDLLVQSLHDVIFT
ncbi:hypothetical protein KC19_11G144700 [Ceratodon purpureus]|uniref:Trichome birefringence-like N-terminal domain-containing protein n=1 Tax=Ceratodon purpureus TaxID=3225 RepID=A0A8T0GF19_CERPU|nr:hypothetical protein KC19_N027900 [Ceratodon purpureus]KAG0557630.1 hypothetical protein KC19_11G144700 [Ceratodon purpureus]